METRSRLHLCGCFFHKLEQFYPICLPTFQSDPEVCTKDYTRLSKGNITDPCVAKTDLVPTCPSTTVQPTLDVQAITKPATSCSLQGATSTTQNPASDCLSFIRNTFAQHDLSSDIIDMLMASIHGGKELKNSTKPMWKGGWYFVVIGRSITVLQR